MTADANAANLDKPDDGTPAKERRLKPQFIAAIILVAVLVLVGGVWLINDLSQRRTVPDLVGETLQSADEAANAVDLELDPNFSEVVASLSDENTEIVEQTPAPGETLRAGDKVEIVVEGREALLPKLVGLSLTDAERAVKRAEFTLVHKFGEHRPPDTWLISEQNLGADSRQPAGSVVEITFDVPEIVLPELLGAETEAARESLIGLGLTITENGNGTHIAKVSIATGTVLEPFDEVELTLGYAVPQVVGLTFTEAKQQLASFSKVTTQGHHSRAITSQSIPAGSFVSQDTEIVLTSPGPETVYRIIGNGSSAMVTWSAPGSFNIQQDTNASLPWEMRFPTDSGYSNFNAQINNGDSITCQVEKNGEIVKELTSTGLYAVISC